MHNPSFALTIKNRYLIYGVVFREGASKRNTFICSILYGESKAVNNLEEIQEK